MLMSKAQFSVSRGYNNQIVIQTLTHTKDISLTKEFENNFQIHHIKMVLFIRVTIFKKTISIIVLSMSIVSKTMRI